MSVESPIVAACAVIKFGDGAVNPLNRTACDELIAVIGNANADPHVRAIILTGRGKHFSAGADIADFDSDPNMVSAIRKLMDSLDASQKPVVAAIRGVALGGGLELAMACHARVSAPDSKLGLPEVTLGILPGGGGTQRLPRLVGAAKALAMMTGGKPISAAQALEAGLIDAIAQDSEADARALALSLADKPLIRTRGRPPASDTIGAVAEARATGDRKASLARRYIIDCVEAAGAHDYAAGEAVEHRLFDELVVSEPALGLRHIFLGERLAARIPGQNSKPAPFNLRSCGIVGAGTMGAGIAMAVLAAGLPVTLIEQRGEALEAAVNRIRDTFARDAAKGKISVEAVEERLSLLTPSTDFHALAGADLVIEAVFERMDIKQSVFRQLDAIVQPGAILASNTSTLDVNAIAAVTRRPERVLGMHFFSPANIMRLLEIVRTDQTSADVLKTALSFARQIGKVGVIAGVCDGFIGNRMFEELLRQAYFLLEEGALPQQLDSALETWGMAMGPLKVMDLAGQDVGWEIRKRRAIEQPDRPYSPIPDRICELGRYGQKTGAGFYLYADGRKASSDPVVDALILRRSEELYLPRRAISDEEIVKRCIYALVNEGAQILAEGIAYRPADIDVIWTSGYGFPAERGGPMFFADRQGLANVLADIQTFAQGQNGWCWQAAPLLAKLASENQRFGGLND